MSILSFAIIKHLFRRHSPSLLFHKKHLLPSKISQVKLYGKVGLLVCLWTADGAWTSSAYTRADSRLSWNVFQFLNTKPWSYYMTNKTITPAVSLEVSTSAWSSLSLRHLRGLFRANLPCPKESKRNATDEVPLLGRWLTTVRTRASARKATTVAAEVRQMNQHWELS